MKKVSTLLAMIFIFGLSSIGFAQKFPSQPFTNLVVFSPGGTTDLQQRVLQEFWQDEFGYPMAIEYMPGAGGQIGWDNLMGRSADGYLVAPNNLPHIILQPIMRKTVYTTQDHIDGAIAGLVIDPVMIGVRQDSKFKNMQDLIDFAKKNPRKVTAGIVGEFTGDWLDLKKLERVLGIELAEVVFPGSADVVAALLGGHIDIKVGNVGCIMTADPEEYRILVIGFKEVPAILKPYMDKVGNPPLAADIGIDWLGGIPRGIFAHPNTPKDRLEVLRKGVWNIINSEQYAKRMFEVGLPMFNQTGEDYAKFIENFKNETVDLLVKFGQLEIVDGKPRPKKK
mgnify:CR=1 FL=1